MTPSFSIRLTVNAEVPPGGPGGTSESQTQMALTSSGMPGPNVVDTAPFWM
ncbi:hypothetical protein FB560_0619 [Microbacterium saperdae]|uniref:Uncharacterized protein n=1 Tax=Microbacterium saperdae TaxID=69368 RepID=A0A543BJM2_9MICO|nr:hypothetical protein FB560_0619 [Microbacterium saperdae]